MLLSVCYIVLRRVLQLAALRFRSAEFKELEIRTWSSRPRHWRFRLDWLRTHLPTSRPRLVMLVDARTIAERLGSPREAVRTCSVAGFPAMLDLGDTEIRERLERPPCGRPPPAQQTRGDP